MNWPQRKIRPRLEYWKWPSPVSRMMPVARLCSTCLRISVLDGVFDVLGVRDAQLAGGNVQARKVIAVVAEDLVETILTAGHVIPAHAGRAAQRRGEGEIRRSPDVAVAIMGGDGNEGEGHIALFAQADGGDRAFLRVPEEAEILPHAVPFPTAIRDVFEARLLHRRGGFGGVREKRGIRDRPLCQAVLDGQAHPPDAGEQLDPWQEKPKKRSCEAGEDFTRQKIQQAVAGREKCEGAELA